MTRRQPIVDALFFATVFTVSFAKIHWNVAGDLSLSDVLTALFLVAFGISRLERWDGRVARCAAVTFAFFLAFLAVYLLGFFNLDTATSLAQWAKGMVKFLLHFLFLFAAVALVVRRGARFYWWALAVFCGGIAFNALYGVLQLGVAQGTGGNLDATVLGPLTGGASQINVYGAIGGANVYRPNAPHRRPEPPRDRADRAAARAAADLPAAREGASAAHAVGARPDVPVRDGARDAVAQWDARLALRHARARVPYRHLLLSKRFLLPLAGVGLVIGSVHRAARRLLRDRAPVARRHEREGDLHPLRRLRVRPGRARPSTRSSVSGSTTSPSTTSS